MKLAVVPVDDDVRSIDTFDIDGHLIDTMYVTSQKCKLTKEQVGVMAETLYRNQSCHDRMDKTYKYYIKDVEEMLKAIGIEVE